MSYPQARCLTVLKLQYVRTARYARSMHIAIVVQFAFGFSLGLQQVLKRLSLLFCLVALLCVSWITAPPAQATDDGLLPLAAEDAALAIIVNKANPIENLTSSDLRSLLLAEQRTWFNGRRVTIVMREPGQPERAAVLRAVCRMTDGDYIKYFMRAQFVGDLQTTPKVLATAAGMRKFVFNVPGAIGYVRASEVDTSVKVVRIDGRLPGEPGYKPRLVSTDAGGQTPGQENKLQYVTQAKLVAYDF